MNIILFDGTAAAQLLPLTYTRPIGALRLGILTLAEKWEKWLDASVSFETQAHLNKKYPAETTHDDLYIYGGLCPDQSICRELQNLQPGAALRHEGQLLAARHTTGTFAEAQYLESAVEYRATPRLITRPYHLFAHNGVELEVDFELLTKGRQSEAISGSNTVIGDRFFAEEGARASCSVFNTEEAPVYLGKNSQVLEGSLVRGGLALGESATLKMGAKIYGPTTIGPHCKVGGEVNNSVFLGYANKGHDGFLGNAVIGEWCNLGADTNNSNLKNNYEPVKMWDYVKGGFSATGMQFCGLVMGDHSKCGINTMFNTGTVIGVSANIFGSGFPRAFIPSFSWGGASGFSEYKLEKALQTARLVMTRRGVELDEVERDILQYVFDNTARFR